MGKGLERSIRNKSNFRKQKKNLQSDIICKQVLYKKRANERPRKINAKNRRIKLKNQGGKSLRIGPKRQRYRKQERIVKKVRK